jgi:hypothetical protein
MRGLNFRQQMSDGGSRIPRGDHEYRDFARSIPSTVVKYVIASGQGPTSNG